jgi:alkaline phosphatase
MVKFMSQYGRNIKSRKKIGCVTTVTVTHATPAGFCINSAKRNAEPQIAEMYAELGFDVLMGGGDEFLTL